MIGRESGVMKAWEATVRKTQAVAKKRANSIFGSISLAPAEEEEDDDCDIDFHENDNCNYELYHAEMVLPNGDYYTGQWAENYPHGEGKYLWRDGCMYVGEWYKSTTMGRGRFSWPSGATYEGEFKKGYMDGTGTYTGSNGDTYKGQWVMNLKHGHGVKSFANGDMYAGEWRQGLQDGHGRYEWKDESHYDGEWRNGTICGKGSFVWANGNRYDGNWEDGLPKGNGAFKWVDGSFYEGNWSKNPKDHNGTYYPSEVSLLQEDQDHHEWNTQEVYNELLNGYVVCQGEKILVFPSQKKLAIWRSTKGGAGGGRGDNSTRPGIMLMDGRVSVDKMRLWEGEEGDHVSGGARTPTMGSDLGEDLSSLQVDDAYTQLPTLKAPKKSPRQGEIISKGHKNYELMLNLQLGIR